MNWLYLFTEFITFNSQRIYLKYKSNCQAWFWIVIQKYFFFSESASDIVEGVYDDDGANQIIYGTFTTPNNAIGGSAICAFSIKDLLAAFEGNFKEQENINSNWLPVPAYKVNRDLYMN